MITKRTGAIRRRARRPVQDGRTLNYWAEQSLNNDDYYAFLMFCKDENSSLTETAIVSRATFERLEEEFKQKKAMRY